MEVAVAVVSAMTSSVMPKLINALEKWWNQLKDQEQDILFLDKHLGMICASIEDQLTHNGQLSAVETISMEDFCDLAQQIEDCLDRFLPCSACQGEKIHDPKKFCAEIARLRQVLKDAFERRLSHNVVPNPNRASLGAGSNAGTAGEDMGTNGASPEVGMEEPKKELREMLVGGEASKLQVVSIVGFGGSGKTALARAVFNCPAVASHFPRRAWAVASKHKQDALGLLKDILVRLRVQQTQTELGDEAQAMPQKLEELQQHITHLLEARRCLIVIDDIKTELWDEITCIIPDKKTESRILVTTAVTSVATACSFDGGYVYSMRSLSVKHSKDYLDKKVFVGGCSPDLERGSTAIVNKCDGHPLALASTAKALQGHKVLTGALCEEITRNLCSEIDKNRNGHFTKLGQVLINNYRSLPGSSLKTCLLYTSLFPNNRPVSRKTLTSRWLAEGYIKAKTGRSDQESADENFKELIDRNIIQPIDASHSGKEKACKPHGIVHQFMLYKSISSNFIATSSDAKGTNFRHLLIDNRTSGTDSSGQTDNFLTSWKYFFKRSACEHLRPRSVTVIGNAGEAVYSNLTNCKLLKVLDLQESNDFQMQHLQKIHKLLHLKYLTLGSSISNLPDEMKKLHYLETLDLRKTKVKTLPLEVISLPHLAHLFGKIKLEEVSSRKFKKFKSNLQTLAGVVIDKDSRIPELMVTMEQLRKVKIWCETNSTHQNYTMLSEAIHKFAQAGMNTPVGTRSLSLHLSDSCKNLLHNHQGDNRNATSIKPGYLTSLKLQGSLSQFHQFVMSLSGLAELCLTYTNLKGANLLAGLRHLKLLVCLKLVEDNLADLEINLGDFPSLQRLCLVVENPIFPTIKHGALRRLVSLQLLCGDLVGLCDKVKLEWFKDLQEVALDSMVKQETIKLWEDETKKHPKRPRVLLLNRVVDPDDTGSVAKYVASCQVNNNCYTDTCTINDMEIDLNELTLQPEPERTRTGPKYRRSDQFIIGSERSRSPHSPERI